MNVNVNVGLNVNVDLNVNVNVNLNVNVELIECRTKCQCECQTECPIPGVKLVPHSHWLSNFIQTHFPSIDLYYWPARYPTNSSLQCALPQSYWHSNSTLRGPSKICFQKYCCEWAICDIHIHFIQRTRFSLLNLEYWLGYLTNSAMYNILTILPLRLHF